MSSLHLRLYHSFYRDLTIVFIPWSLYLDDTVYICAISDVKKKKISVIKTNKFPEVPEPIGQLGFYRSTYSSAQSSRSVQCAQYGTW